MRQVVHVVAAHGDEAGDASGVQRRHDARRPAAPVVARNDCLLDVEGIHEVDEILPEGGLLS